MGHFISPIGYFTVDTTQNFFNTIPYTYQYGEPFTHTGMLATWNATDNTGVNSIDLAWSADGGATFPNAIATGIPNTGTFAWTPAGLPTATARVRVRAYDSGGNVAADSSAANFALTSWTITASAGTNGSIAPAGASGAGDGATPSYAITPASGYRVLDVLVNGASVGAVTNYTFAPVHANQTIAASFAGAAYPINITFNGSGSVTRNPDLPLYPAGSSVTLTAVAPAGWSFDGWSGDVSSANNPVGVTVNAPRNIVATFTQHVFTWSGGASGDWTVASNWSPPRVTPSTDDKLVFNSGGTISVTNVPTQTIGQIVLANATRVSLQGTNVIQIDLSGRAGPDLDVPAGCTLDLTGSSVIVFSIDTGATGLIGGTVNVANAAHRLTATDGGALVFVGGSQLLIGAGFNGSIFGNGAQTSHANSVVMQNGSLLAQTSGNNPFGISVPNTCVLFQAGSRYRIDGNLILSVSGRTYADLEYNYSGALSASGPTPFSVDSLIVSRGTFNWNTTGGGTIRGDIVVKAGATLNMNPSSGTPVAMLGGALLQHVDVAGTFTNLANAEFNVNNPAGVLLRHSLNLSGPLSFTLGRIITGGANTLGVNSTGLVNGAAAGTGWVVGNLRRNFATGTSSRRFDVGDFIAYTPIDVSVNGAAAAFDVTGSTTSGEHPAIASSDLDASHSVNRYWTLGRSAATAFTSYDATFGFDAGDLDPGTGSAQLVARRYAAGWTYPTLGAVTATSVQTTGLTAFGDFALAQVSAIDNTPPTITVTSPNGGEVLLAGNNANLTWNAFDNVGVTGVDLQISRDGRTGTYQSIANAVANTGMFSWNVTLPYTSDAWLRVVAHDAASNTAADTSNAAFAILAATGVNDGAVTEFALAPVSPNPLRGSGTFAFALPRAGRVRLTVLDLQGRQVLALADGDFAAGRHALAWSDAQGATLGAGLYFARMQAGGRTFTQRFVIAR